MPSAGQMHLIFSRIEDLPVPRAGKIGASFSSAKEYIARMEEKSGDKLQPNLVLGYNKRNCTALKRASFSRQGLL